MMGHINLAFVYIAFVCAPLLSEDYHKPKKHEERNGMMFQPYIITQVHAERNQMHKKLLIYIYHCWLKFNLPKSVWGKSQSDTHGIMMNTGAPTSPHWQSYLCQTLLTTAIVYAYDIPCQVDWVSLNYCNALINPSYLTLRWRGCGAFPEAVTVPPVRRWSLSGKDSKPVFLYSVT